MRCGVLCLQLQLSVVSEGLACSFHILSYAVLQDIALRPHAHVLR
jgi:hypothetical protein